MLEETLWEHLNIIMGVHRTNLDEYKFEQSYYDGEHMHKIQVIYGYVIKEVQRWCFIALLDALEVLDHTVIDVLHLYSFSLSKDELRCILVSRFKR